MLDDFLANLAVNLAHDLLRAGADRLRTLAFGDTEQRSLHQCYRSGFRAMLDSVCAGLDRDHQTLVETILRQFVAAPGVAQTLLDVALVGADLPDLPALRAAFDTLDFDRATLPVDFDRALTAFHRGLSEALVAEASPQDSPLFNRVNLGRMLTIQALLQQQGSTLATIVQRLQRIEGQGGAVYNVIIAQATGVAIGDGARVEQALPADVRATLDEVLRLVRDLSRDRRPPPYTADDVRRYLENVIESCQTLDLRGAGGPVDHLPLERVYVALKADASNAAERRANWQQFLADLAAHEQELTSQMLDDRVCVGLDPMDLTLALRNRARAERGDYLALAARRIDLGELIGQERWTVLLGDPGAGKTTLIRWLALRFAQAMLDGAAQVTAPADQVRADLEEDETTPVVLGPPRLPVPVRLADYAAARWIENRDTGLSLFDYLGSHRWQGRLLHPDPAVGRAIAQDAIRNGRALILLDGLDEIAERHRRQELVDAIVEFVRAWVRTPDTNLCAADPHYRAVPERHQEQPRQRGGNQVLITSRPIGYYQAPLPAPLPHYTVEEMSEPAIARFCRTWTAAVHAQTGRTVRGDPAADAMALRAAVLDPQRPALREIAANPLLLTILASLFYNLNGSLPERRIELYDQVVEAFIRQRQQAWASLGLSAERFRYAMGYVAVRLHASPEYPTSLAEESVVQSWLEDALGEFDSGYRPAHREQAGALFRSAADLGGFLLARGDGVYGFIHRTFQEYFAALSLAWDPKRVSEEVCCRLDEPAWHEPLRLAVADLARRRPTDLRNLAGSILAAPEPAPGLLPRNALFLAACLPELPRLPPDDLIVNVVTQLLAACADRGWPPDDETTLPPPPLRNAIERALRPLGALAAARAAFAAALTGADPARRLAAAELILEFDWRHPDLIPPLLAAARDYAEPVTAIREALWRQVAHHPEALRDQDLPLRTLLDDPAQAAALTQRPVWHAILQALYLRPNWGPDKPLTPDAVCFDTRLTPWLRQAWQEGWSDDQLCAGLLDLAQNATDAALARDAAWALAVSDEARWRQWLMAAGSGKITPQVHATLAGVAWGARARARARALDRYRTLARARALALARALA
ncbi:NACHT domain-containing protein, partial [Roseiflexus sp.]